MRGGCSLQLQVFCFERVLGLMIRGRKSVLLGFVLAANLVISGIWKCQELLFYKGTNFFIVIFCMINSVIRN